MNCSRDARSMAIRNGRKLPPSMRSRSSKINYRLNLNHLNLNRRLNHRLNQSLAFIDYDRWPTCLHPRRIDAKYPRSQSGGSLIPLDPRSSLHGGAFDPNSPRPASNPKDTTGTDNKPRSRMRILLRDHGVLTPGGSNGKLLIPCEILSASQGQHERV